MYYVYNKDVRKRPKNITNPFERAALGGKNRTLKNLVEEGGLPSKTIQTHILVTLMIQGKIKSFKNCYELGFRPDSKTNLFQKTVTRGQHEILDFLVEEDCIPYHWNDIQSFYHTAKHRSQTATNTDETEKFTKTMNAVERAWIKKQSGKQRSPQLIKKLPEP